MIRVIDYKLPQTGYVLRKNKMSFKVQWHNGETTLLKKEDIRQKKYKNKKRYKLH